MLNVILVTYEDWQEIFINGEFSAGGHQLGLSDTLAMLSGEGGFSFQEYTLSEETPEEILNLIFPRDNSIPFSERESYIRQYVE